MCQYDKLDWEGVKNKLEINKRGFLSFITVKNVSIQKYLLQLNLFVASTKNLLRQLNNLFAYMQTRS